MGDKIEYKLVPSFLGFFHSSPSKCFQFREREVPNTDLYVHHAGGEAVANWQV